MPLVRKLKAGDRLTIGAGVVIDCIRAGAGTLRLAISADADLSIRVTPQPESALHPPDNKAPMPI